MQNTNDMKNKSTCLNNSWNVHTSSQNYVCEYIWKEIRKKIYGADYKLNLNIFQFRETTLIGQVNLKNVPSFFFLYSEQKCWQKRKIQIFIIIFIFVAVPSGRKTKNKMLWRIKKRKQWNWVLPSKYSWKRTDIHYHYISNKQLWLMARRHKWMLMTIFSYINKIAIYVMKELQSFIACNSQMRYSHYLMNYLYFLCILA